MMHVAPREIRTTTTRMWAELKEGWEYVAGFAPIRMVLLLFAIVGFMGVPYTVLMPVFASKILHGGPHTLGFLMGASGVGALISAVRLAVRKSVVGLYRVIPMCAAIFGFSLIGFAFSRILWLSMLLMVCAGFGLMQQMAASNTVIQTIVSEDKRGRVMSYWTVAFVGTAPFGSLLAGSLSPIVGVPGTLAICGVGCIAGAIWFRMHRRELRGVLRPI
jgi:MFS family permease